MRWGRDANTDRTHRQAAARRAGVQGGMLQCATPCPPQRGRRETGRERECSDFINRADLWPTVLQGRCPDRCCQLGRVPRAGHRAERCVSARAAAPCISPGPGGDTPRDDTCLAPHRTSALSRSNTWPPDLQCTACVRGPWSHKGPSRKPEVDAVECD